MGCNCGERRDNDNNNSYGLSYEEMQSTLNSYGLSNKDTISNSLLGVGILAAIGVVVLLYTKLIAEGCGIFELGLLSVILLFCFVFIAGGVFMIKSMSGLNFNIKEFMVPMIILMATGCGVFPYIPGFNMIFDTNSFTVSDFYIISFSIIYLVLIISLISIKLWDNQDERETNTILRMMTSDRI